MPENKFLPFATGAGATVLSDAAYAGLPARTTGFQNGLAEPTELNKVWRQTSVVASAFGQVIADYAATDANDDGDVSALKLLFRKAMAAMLATAYYGQDTSGTPNVLTVALDPTPPTLTGLRSVIVRVANTNTGPATLALNTFGSRGITRHDGSPLQSGDLVSGQMVEMLFDPILGQFALAGLGQAEVQRLIPSAVLYVRTDGNDNNDGSANDSGHAFQTIASALSAARRIAATGDPLIIRLGLPGTYAMPGQIQRPGGNYTILGDTGNIGGYILSGAGTTSNPPITAFGCAVSLNGLTLNNTGAVASTVGASTGGSIFLASVAFTGVAGNNNYHIAAFSGGSVTIGAGVTIASSMGGWLLAGGGTISIGQVTVTFTGTPTWSVAGINATNLGQVSPVGTPTIAGSALGPRYGVSNNAIVSANGAGPNFYPGSTAGTTSNGGQYV